MKSNLTQQNKGFTMVETLVAIAILMISIAGPLTIAHKGLLAAIYARDNIVASYLAQDGLEFVKNIKDNNRLSGRFWLQSLDNCTSTTKCSVDTINGNPLTASGIIVNCGTCKVYKIPNDRGYTSGSGGSIDTQFSRYFYIIPNVTDSDNEATLIVEVTWDNGTISNIVRYKDEVFNTIL